VKKNLMVMRLIDEWFSPRPFYGVPRMTDWVRTLGHEVNHERIAHLMRLMNLQAVVPGSHTSQPHPAHAVYPYLLRDLVMDRPSYVWCRSHVCADAARILVSVDGLGWYSRYVLAWALSSTQEARFCLDAVDQALASGQPQIFNIDQGAQFTGAAFTGRLAEAKIRISMDARGRARDNVFVARLWRSVAYEEVYLRGYVDRAEAWQGLNRYVAFDNTARRHQSLG
jgi:putative transposase